jgi:hypothetical protein
MEKRRHRTEEWEKSPRPMVDSIMPPGVPVQWFYDHLGDINYRVDRIPMTLPPVLRELNFQGLHHCLANEGRPDYEKVQEMVSFMNKVLPYVRVEEFIDGAPGIGAELRDVLASCPEDEHVTIG